MPNSNANNFIDLPSRPRMNTTPSCIVGQQGYVAGKYDNLEGSQRPTESSTAALDAQRPPSIQNRQIFIVRTINSRSPSPSVSSESGSTFESSNESTPESAHSISDRCSISPPPPLPFGVATNLGRTRGVQNLAGGGQAAENPSDIDLELLDQESSTSQRLRQGAQTTPWASVMDREGLWAQHLGRIAEQEAAELDRIAYEQMLEDQALLEDDSDERLDVVEED